MKTPQEALVHGLEIISAAMDRRQTSTAVNASQNLVRLAYSLEAIHEVFIAETLQAICGHTNYVLYSYFVPRDNVEDIYVTMTKTMNEMVEGYKNDQDVSGALESLRYFATSLVLDAENLYIRRINPSEESGGQE